MSALELALQQPWMARLGWTLVHFLWQGTVIAAVYAIIRTAGGRLLSARARYGLACAALAAMAAAPPVTYLAAGAATPGAAARAGAMLAAGGPWERVLPWLVVAWAAGVSLFSVRLIGGWRMASRITRLAVATPSAEWREALRALAARMHVSAPVRLLVSSLVCAPTVVGWLRPVILVPAEALTGVQADQMRALLAHELAHILRRDYLVNILQSVAEAALFYHPAVWWVSARIRAEREACCDDLAVEATGDVLAYASALAELESHRRARMRLATAADGGSLASRIRRLLGHAEPPSHTLPNPAAIWALSLLWLAGMGAVLAHGANPPLPLAHRAFVPPAALAARAPLSLAAPPSIKPTGAPLLAALLFDPLFAPPLPLAPPQNDPAAVSGVVRTSAGKPVAGATAVLNPLKGQSGGPGPQPRYQVATSDAAGKFAFENVPPGKYEFWTSHQVYQRPDTDEFGPLPPRWLTVAAGQRMDDIKVTLVEFATITGRAVDEDGDPVSHAMLRLYRPAYSRGQRGLSDLVYGLKWSDDNGEFKMRVDPGRYILRADKPLLWIPFPAYTGMFGSRPPLKESGRAPIPAGKPGAKTYNPGTTYYGGSETAAGATPIDVSPGQNISLSDFRMQDRPIVHLRGKVVGDPGVLVRARVVALDRGGWNSGVDIGRDGSFDLANMSPAKDVMIGIMDQSQHLLGWTRISVDDQGLDGLILNTLAAPLTGTLRFEEGPPPDAAAKPIEIELASIAIPGRHQMANAKTSPDGSFTVAALAPGYYEVWTPLPDGSFLKSIQLSGRDLPDGELEWRGSGTLELVVSRKAGVVEGTLVDDEGKPVRGTVTLAPDPPRSPKSSWYRAEEADAQGSFRFPTVPAGTYKLYAWQEIDHTVHWDPDFIRPFESRAQVLEVQEGGRTTVTAKRIPAAVMREALRKAGIY